MGSTHTSTSKSTLPKSTYSTILPLPIIPKLSKKSHTIPQTRSITTSIHHKNIPQQTHTINCQTIIKSSKSPESTEIPIQSPILNPTFILTFSPLPLSKYVSTTTYFTSITSSIKSQNQLRKHLSTPNLPRNHTTHTKNNPIKIRPEFKIPVLNDIS